VAVVTRVVVLDDYQDVARQFGPWSDLGPQLDLHVVTEHLVGRELLDSLAGAEVVVAMRERTGFDRSVLGALPDLRLLVTTGMANAAIDMAAAAELGITVCGTGILASPTAELTWGLVLALARRLPAEDASMRRGEWQLGVGTELARKTFGVIGLGRLGQRVARVAQAFEMRVLGWSQNLDPDLARSLGVDPVSKAELLRDSDFVSLHLKLSDRTRGIIGAADLALMRPSAYLVNTSRGPLVDTEALLAALNDGRIAGAGIDVYDEEPLPREHPLRSAPRTVLTPHVGYVTDGTYQVFFTDAVADIAAWLAGEPLRLLGS
jgi:phosphoglycerate dehydrogenase-like enzyme